MRLNLSLQLTDIKVSIDSEPIEADAELRGDSGSHRRESSSASSRRPRRSTSGASRFQPTRFVARIGPPSERPLLDLIDRQELSTSDLLQSSRRLSARASQELTERLVAVLKACLSGEAVNNTNA